MKDNVMKVSREEMKKHNLVKIKIDLCGKIVRTMTVIIIIVAAAAVVDYKKSICNNVIHQFDIIGFFNCKHFFFHSCHFSIVKLQKLSTSTQFPLTETKKYIYGKIKQHKQLLHTIIFPH